MSGVGQPLDAAAVAARSAASASMPVGSAGAVGVPTCCQRFISQYTVWAPRLRRARGTAVPVVAATTPGRPKIWSRKATEPSEKSIHQAVLSGRPHCPAKAGTGATPAENATARRASRRRIPPAHGRGGCAAPRWRGPPGGCRTQAARPPWSRLAPRPPGGSGASPGAARGRGETHAARDTDRWRLADLTAVSGGRSAPAPPIRRRTGRLTPRIDGQVAAPLPSLARRPGGRWRRRVQRAPGRATAGSTQYALRHGRDRLLPARLAAVDRRRRGRPPARRGPRGAARRVRAGPAGDRAEGLLRAARAAPPARHARPGPHRRHRPGRARGPVPPAAGAAPLPRRDGEARPGAVRVPGRALRRRRRPRLERGGERRRAALPAGRAARHGRPQGRLAARRC